MMRFLHSIKLYHDLPARRSFSEDGPVLHSPIERRRIVFRHELSFRGHELSFSAMSWQGLPASGIGAPVDFRRLPAIKLKN
jgi:hypothetical protein